MYPVLKGTMTLSLVGPKSTSTMSCGFAVLLAMLAPKLQVISNCFLLLTKKKIVLRFQKEKNLILKETQEIANTYLLVYETLEAVLNLPRISNLQSPAIQSQKKSTVLLMEPFWVLNFSKPRVSLVITAPWKKQFSKRVVLGGSTQSVPDRTRSSVHSSQMFLYAPHVLQVRLQSVSRLWTVASQGTD